MFIRELTEWEVKLVAGGDDAGVNPGDGTMMSAEQDGEDVSDYHDDAFFNALPSLPSDFFLPPA